MGSIYSVFFLTTENKITYNIILSNSTKATGTARRFHSDSESIHVFKYDRFKNSLEHASGSVRASVAVLVAELHSLDGKNLISKVFNIQEFRFFVSLRLQTKKVLENL